METYMKEVNVGLKAPFPYFRRQEPGCRCDLATVWHGAELC